MSDKTPFLLKPFAALWLLVSFIMEFSLRSLAVIAGIIFLAVGILLSMSIVGLPLGIPLAIFGALLLFKSIV
ncbi:MAG: hypothetical protein J7M24_06880 [Candidatus Latescibacteria bacterium]|nr:hypothetical protein [Candidatus Latescibacterota bacterium]